MSTNTTDREIVISRLFNAPRELVWAAWTDPKQLSIWMGPRGFSTTTHEIDVRPGGVWRYMMHGPDGTDYPNKIVYIEVARPERLVYDHMGDDESTADSAFHTTVTFEAQGSKTKLTMRSVFPSKEARDLVVEKYGAIEGGNQTLDRLGEHLAPIVGPELVIERLLNAPRALVWKAWIEQERLAQWWGPKGFALGVSKLEMKSGGIFLYNMRSPQGQEMWGRFVYRDVIPPKRLVFINSFSDPQGNITRAPFGGDFTHWPLEILNQINFTEEGGKTKLLMRGTPINATDEERATFTAVKNNVQQGFNTTFDQLEEYLAKKGK